MSSNWATQGKVERCILSPKSRRFDDLNLLQYLVQKQKSLGCMLVDRSLAGNGGRTKPGGILGNYGRNRTLLGTFIN